MIWSFIHFVPWTSKPTLENILINTFLNNDIENNKPQLINKPEQGLFNIYLVSAMSTMYWLVTLNNKLLNNVRQ